MPSQSENSPEKLGVMSPFDGLPGANAPQPDGNMLKRALFVVLALVGVLALVLAGALLWKRTVDNPYRTLEVFPVEKYFENPTTLIGNRFRATLRVEGDLGWNSEIGKLMVFSLEGDPRYMPAVVSEDKLEYAFSKGQTYVAQIHVREGCLLYASDFKKN